MMVESVLARIRQRFEQAERILITSHIRPDGDAVSSVLALGLALQEKGKQVVMALTDGVPAALRYLAGYDQIVNKPDGNFDLIVVVDCGSLDRVGSIMNSYDRVDINIDHHSSNLNFGEINLVNIEAVSVTEILALHFPALGLPLTQPVAEALLTGILTDSQGFKIPSTRPGTLRIAADLYDAGVDLPKLYFNTLSRKSFEAAKYWGAGLSRLQQDGHIVWTNLSCADRMAVEYPGRDDADLVNILSAIGGSDVAVIFIEQDSDNVKVSWRTRSDWDVSKVAQQFGGGGHIAAAGAMIRGGLQEVEEKVIQATKTAFKNS